MEGKETVLVLKDKGVLEEDDGETLINPSLVESEMWKNNAELRKKKPGYNPYDVDDFDVLGNMREKALLGKYDEEIEGKKIESFKLDGSGMIDAQREKQLAEIRAKIRTANQISLQQEPLKLATEYYTEEEAAQFKKPKKKIKKLRKREVLKADDLLPEAEDKDFGSRKRGQGRKKAAYEEGEKKKKEKPKTAHTEKELKTEDLYVDNDDVMTVDDHLGNFVVEDEAEEELHAVLDKARKLKQKDVKTEQGNTGADKVSSLLKNLLPDPSSIKEEPMDAEEPTTSQSGGSGAGTITLDATSEYCRGLGDIPTYGLAGNREDPVDPEDFIDKELERKQRKEQRKLEKLAKKNRKKERHREVPDDEWEQRVKEHQESRGQWVETDFLQEKERRDREREEKREKKKEEKEEKKERRTK